MLILFCADPLDPRQPDAAYAEEVQAAQAAGLSYELVRLEPLIEDQRPQAAVRQIRERSQPELAVYRGWMLRPGHYANLYHALAARGIRLINSPAAYLFCHYLPASYPLIQAHTPRSMIVPLEEWDLDEGMRRLAVFGAGPVILKDYVKSRKHEWLEACYIPSAADRAAVERVVTTFIERQGVELSGGLVFREYIRFAPLTTHSKSGMPLTREYRLFYLDRQLVSLMPYWDEGDYAGDQPPLEQWQSLIPQIHSRFWTLDVAQRETGEWLIVELGDGQVAGLPAHADLNQFYAKLAWLLRQAQSADH